MRANIVYGKTIQLQRFRTAALSFTATAVFGTNTKAAGTCIRPCVRTTRPEYVSSFVRTSMGAAHEANEAGATVYTQPPHKDAEV